MKLHRVVLGLAVMTSLVVGGGIGCTPAETGADKIEISGVAPGSDVPQTQEEYMKRQMEKQKAGYTEAGTGSKKK